MSKSEDPVLKEQRMNQVSKTETQVGKIEKLGSIGLLELYFLLETDISHILELGYVIMSR